jgi:hypothetical protein
MFVCLFIAGYAHGMQHLQYHHGTTINTVLL